MKPQNTSLILPILLIAVGTGWLLSALNVIPAIDWVWTLGLAAIGILGVAICGIDKVTVVISPLFLLASCLSILRQTDRLSLNVEVPILVIATGVLLLISRAPSIPPPNWLLQDPNAGKSSGT